MSSPSALKTASEVSLAGGSACNPVSSPTVPDDVYDSSPIPDIPTEGNAVLNPLGGARTPKNGAWVAGRLYVDIPDRPLIVPERLRNAYGRWYAITCGEVVGVTDN